jgi:excisionase family DNA binding protein
VTTDSDDLLTVDEIAAELRVPEGTFRSWRAQNRGPKSFKIGRRVVYRRADVIAWLAAQEQATARGGE